MKNKRKIVEFPRDWYKKFVIMALITGIMTITSDLFTFILQFVKDAVSEGKIMLCVIGIIVYYLGDIIGATLRILRENEDEKQEEQQKLIVEGRTAQILTKVRSKVKLSDGTLMTPVQIADSLKNYMYEFINIKKLLLKNIPQIISFIIMVGGFVAITNVEIKHFNFFIGIIVVSAFLTLFILYIREKIIKKILKKEKQSSIDKDNSKNDILNIEPQDNKHIEYMTGMYLKSMLESLKWNFKETNVYCIAGFFQRFIYCVASIIIIILKFYEVGFSNINLEVILSIIAIQTIYHQIVDKVDTIYKFSGNCINEYNKIKLYSADVEIIFDTFIKEENRKYTSASDFYVPTFEVEYSSQKSKYKLKNLKEFMLHTGEVILFSGPTGSGKSTFLKMITGKIILGDTFNPTFNSIMHYADVRFGAQSILSEITFDAECDKKRLIDILKGLHLYEEIYLKNNDVISYLKNTTANDYSTGQLQRLLITRLLYNLDSKICIVAFDEATNALNDVIVEQVVKFIKEYCSDKLIIFSSHQVDIYEKYADKHFILEPDSESESTFDIVQVK